MRSISLENVVVIQENRTCFVGGTSQVGRLRTEEEDLKEVFGSSVDYDSETAGQI